MVYHLTLPPLCLLSDKVIVFLKVVRIDFSNANKSSPSQLKALCTMKRSYFPAKS